MTLSGERVVLSTMQYYCFVTLQFAMNDLDCFIDWNIGLMHNDAIMANLCKPTFLQLAVIRQININSCSMRCIIACALRNQATSGKPCTVYMLKCLVLFSMPFRVEV